MYLTIRKYRKLEGDRSLLESRIRGDFVPLIRKVDGFVDYYCIFSDDDTLMTISVFQDEKGARESVRLAATWLQQNPVFKADPPEVISGEVFATGHVEVKKAA